MYVPGRKERSEPRSLPAPPPPPASSPTTDEIISLSDVTVQRETIKLKWRRGKQEVMQKMGLSEVTVDEEFSDMYAHFDQLKRTITSTVKHLNQLSETVSAVNHNMLALSDDFKEAYTEGDPMHALVDKLRTVSEDIDVDTLRPFREKIHGESIDVLGRYLVRVEDVKKMIDQRKDATLEYDFRRYKVKKMTEKPPKDPVKLPMAREKMQRAKDAYDQINDAAKKGMISVLQDKTTVFDPALKTTIDALVSMSRKFADSLVALNSVKPNTSNRPAPVFTSRTVDVSNNVTSPLYPSTDVSLSSDMSSRLSISSAGSPAPASAPSMPSQFDLEWFYLDRYNEQQGPVDFNTLRRLYQNKDIGENSHVFGGDMEEWKIIRDLPELHRVLAM